ncbi:MAG: glycosyltransferase [Clostridia bacterium]|nr:glycosyltransferase [Clostridia bacterium]
MQAEKVSVIIAVYNCEEHIEECVESIISQTYGNIELILVDDGSTDMSGMICGEFAACHEWITCIHGENEGLSAARNKGLDEACGEYVIFMDADDHAEPDMVKTAVEKIAKTGADACIWGYYADFVDNAGHKIKTIEHHCMEGLYAGPGLGDIAGTGGATSFLGYAWNKIYKRGLIEQGGHRFEKGLSLIEDIVFNSQVLSQCKGICFIDRLFTHYMQRPAQSLGKKFHEGHFRLMQRASGSIRTLYEAWGSDTAAVNEIVGRVSFGYLKSSLISLQLSELGMKRKKQLLDEFIGSPTGRELLRSGGPGSLADRAVSLMLECGLTGLVLLAYGARVRRSSQPGCSENGEYIKKSAIRLKLFARYMLSPGKGEFPGARPGVKKIVVALAADYGNLGDAAITVAQSKYLEKRFHGYSIVDFPISATFTGMKRLRKSLSKEDIITLTGGGNTGDRYDDIEYCRQFIIKRFRKNAIFSFPQTVEFSRTPSGARALARAVKVYSGHRELVLSARDRKSYEEYRRSFKDNECVLAPDAALLLEAGVKAYERSGILMCMRNDGEKKISAESEHELFRRLSGVCETKMIDTHIDRRGMTPLQREEELEKLLDEIKKARLVVTDRLHGMIICAVAKTPCIALDNGNRKISGFYECWLKGLGFIDMMYTANVDETARRASVLAKMDTASLAPPGFTEEFEVIGKMMDGLMNNRKHIGGGMPWKHVKAVAGKNE